MSHRSTSRYTWTYAEYARFPDDGNRYEVLDGEVLVTPSPSPMHQHVAATLLIALRQYVEGERLGVVLPEVDLLFAPGQFLRPDLLFVPEPARSGITDRGVETAPGLVVEVLSPTSASLDRLTKPRRYGDFGVPEYWVADPEEQVMWVWRFHRREREPDRVTELLIWQPPGAAEPLELEVRDVFRSF